MVTRDVYLMLVIFYINYGKIDNLKLYIGVILIFL
jgi:hypothetical protein